MYHYLRPMSAVMLSFSTWFLNKPPILPVSMCPISTNTMAVDDDDYDDDDYDDDDDNDDDDDEGSEEVTEVGK